MNQIAKNSKNHRPIILTQRDSALFAKLGSLGVLNSEQIKALFFASLPRTRRRLLQLWQHGFLKRIQRPVLKGDGSSKYYYSLSPKALRQHALSNTEIEPPKYRRTNSVNLHQEKIIDFRICLELANRWHDPELKHWEEGKTLKLQTSIDKEGIKRHLSLIPDAFFTVSMAGKDYAYFLEMDMGTTDLTRIVRKCQGYLNLFNEKTPQLKFAIRSFRVLFVTTSSKRTSNILEQIGRIKSKATRLDLFSFTDFNSYSLERPRQIFEPIWLTIGTDGKATWSRPLPSLPPSTFPTEPGKPLVH